MVEYYLGRNYTGAELRTKQADVIGQLINYVNKKIPTFGDHYIRETLPVEDFAVTNATGVLSTIFPAVAGIETMEIQIPVNTDGWFYALSAQWVAEKGLAFYGMEIPQSTPIYGVRGGYGKDTTGGVEFVYSFNGLGGADVPRYYTFKTPFVVAKGDNFWIQFMGVNSNGSTPLMTGAVPLMFVDTQTKSPM